MAGITKQTVNLSQASAITGISVQTLKRHIKKGYLRAYQYDEGCAYHIRLSDLELYAHDLYMQRNKFPNLAMYNPFIFFADRRDLVLNRYEG